MYIYIYTIYFIHVYTKLQVIELYIDMCICIYNYAYICIFQNVVFPQTETIQPHRLRI